LKKLQLTAFHQKFNKLLSADHSVVILIYFLENVPYALLRVGLVFQEKGYLVVGDLSGMINVEVRKCLLKVIFCEEILGLETSHNKLSQINKARVVGVNESHHKIHFACRNVRFGS